MYLPINLLLLMFFFSLEYIYMKKSYIWLY
jgi:hypothetical protein